MELTEVGCAFECAETASVGVTLSAISITEGLSELFEAAVTLRTHTSVASDDLLGQNATLVFGRTPELTRRFSGIIARVDVEAYDRSEPERGAGYEVFIRPAMWALTIQRGSRVFQAMTAPEIAQRVLTEGLAPYEREVRVELQDTYPRREYCVQYQETPYDFVRRLLAEEGIRFSFVQEEDREVVVLRDRNAAYAKLETFPEPGVLHLNPSGDGEDREWLRSLMPTVEVQPTRVRVRDADFTRNGIVLEEETEGADPQGRDRVSYEHGSGRSVTIHDYEEGVRRYRETDAKRQATIRLEEQTQDGWRVLSAASHAVMLAPGSVFAVRDHGLAFESELYVTHVHHEMRAMPGATLAELGGYHNTFDCQAYDREYRPPRRETKPRIPSIQTAIVTGPEGEEIHVDEYGRIKVQFHWDREGALDEKTSCWVRCQQSWAGNGFGTWWVPRIGMEVVVQFVDGDPDRPLVTGCVYNADNALPYPLPDEKTKSTIKSNSSIGGGGFNEFRFEDKLGEEEIWLHAQKDLNEVVLHDHTLQVVHDETIQVGVDRTIGVGRHFTETIGGNEVRVVEGTSTETIAGVHTRTVSGPSATTIHGGMTLTVIGGITRNIVGGVSEKHAGNFEKTITGNAGVDVKGAAPSEMAFVGGVKVSCGGGSIEIDSGGNVTITGVTVTVKATGGDVAINGSPNVKLNC